MKLNIFISPESVYNELEKTGTAFSLEELHKAGLFLKKQGKSDAEIKDFYNSLIFKFSLSGLNKENLIQGVLWHLNDYEKELINGSFELNTVDITEKEIEILTAIDDDTLRRVLYFLLIVSKWNNHPSGYIRFRKEDILDFWRGDIKPQQLKQIMRSSEFNKYIKLLVIGAKRPVICFSIAIRSDEQGIFRFRNGEEVKTFYNNVWGEDEQSYF